MSVINKIKYNGQEYDLYGLGGDVLPVGTELDIDKTATIPAGWEEVEYDTGWVDISSYLNSKCTVPTGSGANINTDYTPKIRRIGNQVYLRGRFDVSKSSITTNALTVFSDTLPSKFLPTKNEVTFHACTTPISMMGLYITPLVRTSDAGKICCWADQYFWNIPSGVTTIQIKLGESWAVDDMPTKRIKKVTQTTPPSLEEIYDGEERIIGTYYGDTLYRKCLTITKAEYNNLSSSTSNRKFLPVTSLNIESLFRADMQVNWTDEDKSPSKCYSMHPLNTSNAYEIGVNSLEGNSLLLIIGSSVLSGMSNDDKANIVLEYTKTTANS